jgi:hypothetical protein
MRNILCLSALRRMAVLDHFPSSGFMVGRSERNRKLPFFPAAPSQEQAWCNGSTPVPHRNHSHVERDPHGSGSGVVRVHHAYHMGALPLHHAWHTVVLPSDHRRRAVEITKRIPRNSRFAHWTPEPKDENIQHPTTNVEHPVPAISAVIGCWVFDVGCWMFPRFKGLRKRWRWATASPETP